MKFYIASRTKKKDRVAKLYKLLKENGHQIASDWTLHKNTKPYIKHQDLSRRYALEDVKGVKDCDVFIIVSTGNGGRGMYVELGAAILSYLKYQKPKIYVVGKYNHNTIFYFHPSVNRRNNIQEVLVELGIK